jgi:hypothetical protein
MIGCRPLWHLRYLQSPSHCFLQTGTGVGERPRSTPGLAIFLATAGGALGEPRNGDYRPSTKYIRRTPPDRGGDLFGHGDPSLRLGPPALDVPSRPIPRDSTSSVRSVAAHPPSRVPSGFSRREVQPCRHPRWRRWDPRSHRTCSPTSWHRRGTRPRPWPGRPGGRAAGEGPRPAGGKRLPVPPVEGSGPFYPCSDVKDPGRSSYVAEQHGWRATIADVLAFRSVSPASPRRSVSLQAHLCRLKEGVHDT